MVSSHTLARAILLLLVGVWECSGDEVPTPGRACVLAHGDAMKPGVGSPHIRYFFTLDRSKEFYGAFSWTINSCLNHSTIPYKPVVTGDGWLIRCDLNQLSPQKKHLVEEFEKLVTIEPYFHTIGELKIIEKENVLVDTAPYQQDGRTYTKKWEQRDKVVRVEKGAEFALHLGNPSVINELALITQSNIPIVRADWFMFIALSQDPRENGRYYNFRGIKNSSGGKTAEELWLESQGVDYESIKKRRVDQRIAKWRSRVTGNSRAIEYFYVNATRPSVGPSAVFITRDWFNGKIDPSRHPLKNLLNYDYDGAEGIGFTPAGFPEFILLNNKGDLVDIAPQNLVGDRTVPSPHPPNLQPAISCIRCHGPSEMWMEARNDVETITRGKYGINIFDDTSEGITPEDALDRLTGLYSGEINEPLRQIRNTLARSTFIATNGMSIPKVAEKISEVYQKYRFDPIIPSTACLELGIEVTPIDAVKTYNSILPKLPPNRHGISPETILVGSLRDWKPELEIDLPRTDWEHEYSDIMLRVVTAKIAKELEQKND